MTKLIQKALQMIFIVLLSIYFVFLYKIDQFSNECLLTFEEVDSVNFEDNYFSKIFWFQFYGNDEYRFKRKPPYIGLIIDFILYPNVYDHYDESFLYIPDILIDRIYREPSDNQMKKFTPRISSYWILWNWDGREAMNVLFDNLHFTDNVIGVEAASEYYFNKDYTELNPREATELAVRAYYTDWFCSDEELYNQKVNEIYSEWILFKQ